MRNVLMSHATAAGALPSSSLHPPSRCRWENKLRPGLKTDEPFTLEEHEHLMQLVKVQGHAWRAISEAMTGRSPAALKNYYYRSV